MHITSTTTLDHWREFQDVMLRHLSKTRPLDKTILYWVVSILMWIFIAIAVIAIGDDFDWRSAAVASVIFFTAFVDYLYGQYRRGRAIRPLTHGMALGTHEFDFNPGGIDVTGPHHSLHVDWELVTGYLETPRSLIILLEDVNGLVLSREDIADPEPIKRLVDEHRAIVVSATTQV